MLRELEAAAEEEEEPGEFIAAAAEQSSEASGWSRDSLQKPVETCKSAAGGRSCHSGHLSSRASSSLDGGKYCGTTAQAQLLYDFSTTNLQVMAIVRVFRLDMPRHA